MNFIKIYNIFFYNFRLVDYRIRKIILVYLNPLCWLENLKYLKDGFKRFIDCLDINFLPFLTLYRQDYLSKKFFSFIITCVFWTILNFIIYLLKLDFTKFSIIIPSLISLIFSSLLNKNLLYKNDRFFEYHKEFSFSKTKEYNYPFSTFLLIILIHFTWLFSFTLNYQLIKK